MKQITFILLLFLAHTTQAQISWDLESKLAYGPKSTNSTLRSFSSFDIKTILPNDQLVVERGTNRLINENIFENAISYTIGFRVKKTFRNTLSLYSGLSLSIMKGSLTSQFNSFDFIPNGVIDTISASMPTNDNQCVFINSPNEISIDPSSSYRVHDLIIPFGAELHFSRKFSIYGALELATPIYSKVKRERRGIEELGEVNGVMQCQFVKKKESRTDGFGFKQARPSVSFGMAYAFNPKWTAILGIHAKGKHMTDLSLEQVTVLMAEAGIRYNLSKSKSTDTPVEGAIFE